MAARWGRLRGAGVRAFATLGPESEEEAAIRLEQKRLEKLSRLRRIQRQMEPPGPPERTLSRAAMEQMRYLRRNSPEEWPVSRLARSFDVTPDVVARVLRSRFSPSPERAAKQDSRVQPQQGGGLSAPPEPPGQLVLASRAEVGALAPQVTAPKKKAGRSAPPPASSRRQGSGGEEPAEQDDEPPLQVVQKGREFFDGDGNFLYRIPG